MAIPIDALRHLKETSKYWYIVADMNVLLDDIHFLRCYIVGDPKCKLLTPIFILDKIEELCDSENSQRYNIARKSIQQLEFCSRHVRYSDNVQGRDSPEPNSDEVYDVILNCCLQLMSHDIHVVLITKDNGLRTLAEIKGVHVYNLDEIKTGARRNRDNCPQMIYCTFRNQPTQQYNKDRYRCIRFASSRNNNRYSPYRSNYNNNSFSSNRSNYNRYNYNRSNYHRYVTTDRRSVNDRHSANNRFGANYRYGAKDRCGENQRYGRNDRRTV